MGIVVGVSKLSAIILDLAVHALKQPVDRSTPEAVAVALLPTHMAWNRPVDPFGGDLTGQYRKVLKALRQENPGCLRELKSHDLEAIIADMAGRLFVSRDTLWRLERGDATVSVGTLAKAAFALQLHDRLADLAAPASDALVLSLDERRLPKRIRRPRA